MSGPPTGHTSYEIHMDLPAPPDRVWAAFTEPAKLAEWVWGEMSSDVRAEVDLRVGGLFLVSADVSHLDWGVERADFRGIYAAIESPSLLAHTVHWDAPVGYNEKGQNPLDEIVVVRLQPEGPGTSLSYLHAGIPDDGISAPEHERSVRSTLAALAKVLST